MTKFVQFQVQVTEKGYFTKMQMWHVSLTGRTFVNISCLVI